jgi:hypothetical protein
MDREIYVYGYMHVFMYIKIFGISNKKVLNKTCSYALFQINLFIYFIEFHVIFNEIFIYSVINKQTMTVGKSLPLTTDQFYEKKEILREKIIFEAKRLGLSLDLITGVFSGKENLSGSEFKKKMRDLGFSLVDFRDEDIMVLDENGDGTISCEEFLNYVKKGYYLCMYEYYIVDFNLQIRIP